MTARKAAKKAAKKAAGRARKKPAGSAGKKPAKATPLRHEPARLVELVERYLDAFNRADVDAVLALYHPRATMEDPVGYTPARGHRAIGEVYRGGFRQGVTIVPDGAVRCTERAVAFPVVARTATATLQSVNVFEVGADGRIERMRAYWGPYNVVGSISVRG